MEVKIKTLTPLWTGGIETGKVDRIHETGILGSLRWWMEVLVRGMGGEVCDPTSESRSGLDPKKFDAKKYRQLQDEGERRQYLRNAGLCDVSQIFGATGWKRRFRFAVIQDSTQSDKTVSPEIKLQSYQYQYKDKQGKEKNGTRTPTWYFSKKNDEKPKSGTFTINIQSLHPDFKPEVIGGLIQFIADWSALGARSQMGFGVIQVEGTHIDMQPLYDWLITTAGSNTYSDLPSLQNIFLAKIQPKESNLSFKEEDTFNLKYDLRKLFRTDTEANKGKEESSKPRPKKKGDGDKDLRHFIMGTAKGDRMAAKIKTSRAYNDKKEKEDGNKKLMRVWGWIPEEAEVYKNGWDREKIVNDIHQHLTANYTLPDWREMNSDRDTQAKKIDDAKIFLRSLLKLSEDG